MIQLGGAEIFRESGGVDAFAKKRRWVLAGLAALAAALAFLSASYGTYTQVRAPEVLEVLAQKSGLLREDLNAATTQEVVLDLRLPRVALAILSGAALGMAGAALQGLFRNPLADPALIGVSGGGGVGRGGGDRPGRRGVGFAGECARGVCAAGGGDGRGRGR